MMVPVQAPASASSAVATIHNCVREALIGRRCLLAVSGGADSMVLLDAAAATLDRESLTVATFDHLTGEAAQRAVSMVSDRAAALGIECVVGRAMRRGRTEAEWRQERWHFLRSSAREKESIIVTAHTQDDQVETVFIRILRDAGPRGLAGLYAESDVLRPLLYIFRRTIVAYAEGMGVPFLTDPSNIDRRHLRNRVRHDLLPAILAERPCFAEELLDLAHRAAQWRARMEQVAATFTVMTDATGAVHIPHAQFEGLSAEELRVLWPSLAARAGVVMDWRGTHRIASFTIEGAPGQAIQLSGNIEVRMQRSALVIRGSHAG